MRQLYGYIAIFQKFLFVRYFKKYIMLIQISIYLYCKYSNIVKYYN